MTQLFNISLSKLIIAWSGVQIPLGPPFLTQFTGVFMGFANQAVRRRMGERRRVVQNRLVACSNPAGCTMFCGGSVEFTKPEKGACSPVLSPVQLVTVAPSGSPRQRTNALRADEGSKPCPRADCQRCPRHPISTPLTFLCGAGMCPAGRRPNEAHTLRDALSKRPLIHTLNHHERHRCGFGTADAIGGKQSVKAGVGNYRVGDREHRIGRAT